MADTTDIISEIDSFSIAKSYLCPPDQCAILLKNPNKYIKIIHQNIRSIKKNLNLFISTLALTSLEFDILVLTECWLKVAGPLPKIDGYTTFSTSNHTSQNDGVVIYAKSLLNVKVSEPHFLDGNCLVCHVGNELCLISLYRSPSYKNIDNFLDSLYNLVHPLPPDISIALIGDMNIDIKANNVDRLSDQYLTHTAALGLLPTHSIPTRQNNCLDHILLRTKLMALTMVIDSPVTDHLPVLLCLGVGKPKHTPPKYSNKIDFTSILDTFEKTNFTEVLECSDANKATDMFISTVSSVIKRNTRQTRVPKRQRIIKPWITPGLLRCIRNRDKMHKEFKKNPDNTILKITYQRYRNFCNLLLRKLKREYDRNELVKAKGNSKATWNAIKTITHTRHDKQPAHQLLKLEDDPTASANKVNRYFVNIGKTLASQITPSYNIPGSENSTSQPNSLVILEVSHADVENIIMSLRGDCAVGWDGVSSKIIKMCKNTLIPPITHICNLSINTGTFPRAFKKALVHPIHKDGNRDVVSNYRPISVLTTLSKILERILNNNLVNFFRKYNTIAPNQYGFRPGISTEDAIASLTDQITKKIDSRIKCFAIFLDLSKAFDTVSIPILIRKMESAGIRGNALNIFKDFLTDRRQCVKIDSVISSEETICYGVPQGSIISPSLFQLYVNDLCNLKLQHCDTFMYADDTVLLAYGADWKVAKLNAEASLRTVMSWLSSNLLTLNISKTKAIAFRITAKSAPRVADSTLTAHVCQDSTSSCTCPPLNLVSNTKYLGVYIDERLDWHMHLGILKTRVRRLIYIFKNLRDVADIDTMRLVYLALCQSILSYCIPIWGGTDKSAMLSLERAQRALLKVMTRKPRRYPTVALYKDCNCLSVRKLFILRTILRKHASLPPTKDKAGRRGKPICNYAKIKTSFATHQYSFLASKLYNSLNKTKNIHTLNQFNLKKEVSSYLFNLTYDETEKLLTRIA